MLLLVVFLASAILAPRACAAYWTFSIPSFGYATAPRSEFETVVVTFGIVPIDIGGIRLKARERVIVWAEPGTVWSNATRTRISTKDFGVGVGTRSWHEGEAGRSATITKLIVIDDQTVGSENEVSVQELFEVFSSQSSAWDDGLFNVPTLGPLIEVVGRKSPETIEMKGPSIILALQIVVESYFDHGCLGVPNVLVRKEEHRILSTLQDELSWIIWDDVGSVGDLKRVGGNFDVVSGIPPEEEGHYRIAKDYNEGQLFQAIATAVAAAICFLIGSVLFDYGLNVRVEWASLPILLGAAAFVCCGWLILFSWFDGAMPAYLVSAISGASPSSAVRHLLPYAYPLLSEARLLCA